MLVRVHGEIYDLTTFVNKHPGGKDVLETASQMEDATPMFESYHSLKDIKKIKNIATSYRIGDVTTKTAPKYTYRSRDFYRTLQKRVNDYYFSKNTTKATWWWFFKVMCILMFSVWIMYGLFSGESSWLDNLYRGCVIGMCHVSIGFNVMHDASHFAISENPVVNETISRITNASLLWNHHIWARHHVYAHHSFTGEITHDPDSKNMRPFLRKSRKDPIEKYIPTLVKNQSYLVLPILCGIPGQFFGQSLFYFMASFKNRVWGVPIDSNKIFHKRDIFSYILTTVYHMYTIWNYPAYVIGYYISANTLYYLCIAPDHDTYESTILDHVAERGSRDWGELQVRRSANFGSPAIIVSELFGGINYQIEHHLFPSVCHVHYPYISTIVRKTCKEYGIPYNTFSWSYAIRSCFDLYSHSSKF
jgi:fatty acid desaturase